jgi:hypothetical protein
MRRSKIFVAPQSRIGRQLPAYVVGPLTYWLENHFLFMLFPSDRSGIRRSLILLGESLSGFATFEQIADSLRLA